MRQQEWSLSLKRSKIYGMNNGWINLDDSQPLLAMKEVMPRDVVYKDGIPYPFPEPLLKRIATSINELIADGIAVPLTTGHNDWENPVNRLGKVTRAVVETNEAGNPVLTCGFEFADDKAKAIATNAEVSIGYVPEFVGGNGKKYEHVVRHIAATSAAVVPGMSGWGWRDWPALAASFGFEVENTYMSAILEHLNVADEAAALEVIKKLQEAAKPAEKIELSYPATVIKALQDARIAQLDALVATGEITPAVKGELALAFCNEKNLGLELSHQSTDDYDLALKLVKLASKSQPVSPTGRSQKPIGDGVELSHEGSETYLDRFKKWAEQNK